MRTCDGCNLCCVGIIPVKIDNKIYHNKPCCYLNNNCSIYETRPEVCRKFECLWLQDVLPEEFNPKTTKILACLIKAINCNFYKFILPDESNDMQIMKIQEFCKSKNMPYVIKFENNWFVCGSKEFKETINKNKKIFLD